MNQEIKAPEFEILSFFPKDFFNKNVNEEFIKFIMQKFLPQREWIKGDANKKEPDYICDGKPYEFTLASDKCSNKNKNNFIKKMKIGDYTSENVEKDAFYYIEEQIKDKKTKKYSLENVNLCILCILDRFDWVSDEYGSLTHFLTDYQRECFFKYIKETYIDTKRFNNIFLIFPDIVANWCVWDVKWKTKAKLQVEPFMMEAMKYPYFIEKRLYTQFVENGIIKDLFRIINKKDA